MSESSTLRWKAFGILVNSTNDGLLLMLHQLSLGTQTAEYQGGRTLYDFCVSNFPDRLTLILLKVYRDSSNNDDVRVRSIHLLSETLQNRNLIFASAALEEIKPLLISCLEMPKAKQSDTEILRNIVSFVACKVSMLNNGGWDELSNCILSLAKSGDHLGAFNIFLGLPPVSREFMGRIQQRLLDQVTKIMENPDKDWTLALETVVKLGTMLLNSQSSYDMASHIICIVLESANTLVNKGMQESLQRSFDHLLSYLLHDLKLCKYNIDQCGFLVEFAYRLNKIGTHRCAKKISIVVKKYVFHPRFILMEDQQHGVGLDYEVTSLSALQLLTLFAASDSDNMVKEVTIKRLYFLLQDHTFNTGNMDISEIRQLQPLLISCLENEEISGNVFKILGKVVFHVAFEVINVEGDLWSDLWLYIASEKSGFKRAVYIFQCLTMWLGKQEDFIPTMHKLVPRIYTLLDPPKELSGDYSDWILAFTGAFCANINFLDITTHASWVEPILMKMISSVKELVKRGMEVGVVTSALNEVESIVQRQWKWYNTLEYKFVKNLVLALYDVEGMGLESKISLWRINASLGKNIHPKFKK